MEINVTISFKIFIWKGSVATLSTGTVLPPTSTNELKLSSCGLFRGLQTGIGHPIFDSLSRKFQRTKVTLSLSLLRKVQLDLEKESSRSPTIGHHTLDPCSLSQFLNFVYAKCRAIVAGPVGGEPTTDKTPKSTESGPFICQSLFSTSVGGLITGPRCDVLNSTECAVLKTVGRNAARSARR